MKQEQALRIMETGANVFLTGAPGAGKSYTLRQFTSRQRKNNIHIALTASTGIAATQIDGQTIHSWAGIGISKTVDDNKLRRIRFTRGPAIQDAQILIIDEVSMIPAYLLDTVDRICRYVRFDDRPFGGLQVIMTGDFFQLPPVTGRDRDTTDYQLMMAEYAGTGMNPEGFVTESKAWKEMRPTVCYLTEQHRQESGELLKILTDIRQGTVDTEDRNLLQSRVGITPDNDRQTVNLYPLNRNADAINQEHLMQLPGSEKRWTARTKGEPKHVDRLLKNMLAPERLVLKEGATVMTVRNDSDGAYVNGSIGVVREVRNAHPIIQLNNGLAVQLEAATWETVDRDEVLASVTQMPLRLAWAITVHKSQGMSLDSAMMDLSRTFAPGMGYVALSRVTSMDGLFLQGLNDRVFMVSDDAICIDETLRHESELATAAVGEEGAVPSIKS